MSTTKKLTRDQVKQLGETIDGNGSNVYAIADEMFGFRPGEEVFGQLREAGYSKCPECSTWQTFADNEEEEPICDSCLDAMEEEEQETD